MTTYVVSFTLATAETNETGQYPILAGDSTFLPDCTIFVKAGDTIRYTVTVSYTHLTLPTKRIV